MAGDLSHECEGSSSRETGGINFRQRLQAAGLLIALPAAPECAADAPVDFP
jgi:hypothetical protein